MSDTGRITNSTPNMQNIPLNTPEAKRLKDAFLQSELQTIMAVKPDNSNVIVREWIRTEFNLPASIRSKCDEFFLRVQDGSYVLSQVKEGKLTRYTHKDNIWQDCGDYIVHWQSTPEVCRTAAKVACSFRLYEGVGYVVIKVWKGEQE